MGTFGIEYSTALPTAQPGLEKAHLDLDQGYGKIGEAVTNLGKTMFAMGKKQKDAQDAADLAELVGQDQMMFMQMGGGGMGAGGAGAGGAGAGGGGAGGGGAGGGGGGGGGGG